MHFSSIKLYYKIEASEYPLSSASDVGSVDLINPSHLPNVRSDAILYYQTKLPILETAYVQKGVYFGHNLYHRIALGYFEIAYGGVASELLYYPVGKPYALGLSGALLLKRNYQGLGFTRNVRRLKKDGTTICERFTLHQYFLNLYYQFPPLGLQIKGSLGYFLARDFGLHLEIGRTFPSGFKFCLYYDWTSAHDTVNGRRYHNKGIVLSLPLDLFLPKSSLATIHYSLDAWLRDTAARAQTGKPLYSTLYTARSHLPPRLRNNN